MSILQNSIIDSHAHLTSAAFESDLEEVLARAEKAHIKKIVNISTHPDELEKALQLNKPHLFHVAATTPHDVHLEGEAHFDYFAKKTAEGRLCAVGETGLDYYNSEAPKPLQHDFFCKYLTLAKTHALPLVIHCRDAFHDLFAVIDDIYPNLTAVLHCFTGNISDATLALDRGLYISLSGIITFKKSEALREVVKHIPLDHLLIETDAPYLAPGLHRGKRNEPSFLPETAKALAEIKGITCEEVCRVTTANTEKLFNI